MTSNVLLKFIIPLLVFFVVLGAFAFSRGDDADATAGEEMPVVTISKDEAKVLGIEGDTKDDTLATIVGQLRDMKESVATLTSQNEALKQENERLQAREANTDKKIAEQLREATEKVKEAARQAEISRTADQVQQKLQSLAAVNDTEELPVGLGLEEGDGGAFVGGGTFNLKFDKGKPVQNRAAPRQSGVAPVSLVWVEPLDVAPVSTSSASTNNKPAQFAFPSDLGGSFEKTANTTFNAAADAIDSGKREITGEKGIRGRDKDSKPVYTIAQNATLMGSTGMTALIGRVPIDGLVTDPYPFKILIGKDNLMANGIELPNVIGAVMSGTATGDWTLSCVRGQLNSITFVFDDGTIRTVPEPGQNTNKNSSNSLGYISDSHGIPCLSGARKSNAVEYLSTSTLFTAAGAFLSDHFGDESVTTYNNGTTYDRSNRALQNILEGGIEDVRSWNDRLNGQAFAAIYVPPNAPVAVHIEQEILIDYEPNGRKVNYHANSNNWIDLD